MTLARLLTALALAAAAAGCGTGGGSEAPSGSWQLTSGTGPAGPLDTPPAHRITLVLEDERVGGTAACNSYGGPVEIEGDRIVVGGLAVTEIACEPPRVMAAEAAYLDALGLIDTIRREELLLVLTGPSVELRFEPLAPVPARQLLGTRWELDTVIRGDVASTPAAAATLRLDGGGGLVGETGCRPLRGRYVLRGDEIRVTELAADEAPGAGGCLAAVVEQDRLVLDVLGDGFRVAVEGDRLTLTSSGPDALVYRAP